MFADWVPTAVVFDCDGLLVDTESCWTAAETELFARRGLEFAGVDKAALIGVSVPAACALLAERFADGCTADAVQDELTGLVFAIVARTARAMEGAHEIVAAVLARVPAAVASNSPRLLLDQALQRGGLADALGVSVAADEVAHPKPAPDLYLAACERLGVDPRDALAFEDSATGIRAATAAGMHTVGVPTLAGEDIGAEVTIASLADPELGRWITGWILR